MSARKYDKNSFPEPSKRSTPISSLRNQNSNLTERVNITSRLNMTTRLAVPAPTVDWDLQCDLAYGTYLQSLLTQQLVKEAVKKHTIAVNDQLSLQADLLAKQVAMKHKLEEGIEKLELKQELTRLSHVLRTLLDHANRNLNPDTESQLNNLIKIVESACDYLYLKQVKPLECQQEFEKFEKLLQRSVKALHKVLTICGDVELVGQFGDALGKYERVCCEIAKAETSVVNLEDQVQTSVLNHVSEKLATYRGYN